MLIEWYGHSCFKITSHDYSIVLDPYKPGMIHGLEEYSIQANQVLCSHNHADHNYVETVNLIPTSKRSPFQVTVLESFHDDHQGAKRGTNNLTILTSNDMRVAHLGDLGCELTMEQIEILQGLDVLLIPVGGYYTIDAEEAKEICDILQPRIIIPMHYRGDGFGPSVIATVDDFLCLFPTTKIHRYQTNRFEFDEETDSQIAVLKYR